MSKGDRPPVDDPMIEKEAGETAEPQSRDAAAPEEPEAAEPTTAERIAAKYEVESTTIETAEQAQEILQYFEICSDHGSHLFLSYDKLGNLPRPLQESLRGGIGIVL